MFRDLFSYKMRFHQVSDFPTSSPLRPELLSYAKNCYYHISDKSSISIPASNHAAIRLGCQAC